MDKVRENRIGFVGVGRMGSNMARRLHDCGFAVVAVYDVVLAKAQDLAQELGCFAAKTPAEVSEQASVIFTVVTDDAAMRDVFAEGAVDGVLRHGAGRTFINCATLSPSVHVDLERIVHRYGGETLEACMASSITQAREGSLYLMCGGERQVFEGMKPLLDSLSAAVRFIGPAGEAAKVKALVNMVMNCNTAALVEGLGLGQALGLDVSLLREVFAQTGAASRVLETDGADMQTRDHECYFSAEHAAKDSGIALRLAQEVEIQVPVAQATFEQYQRLIQMGKGHLDKSGVAELTFPGRGGRKMETCESPS